MTRMLRTLVLTLAAVIAFGAVAHAEIVFLKDGRMLHVEILSGDERGIEVRRLDTDGKVFIRWDLLREEDRKRLRVSFGLEDDDSDADLFMEGHRIYTRRGDYYDGLIVDERQESLDLRQPGRIQTILVDAIRSREERRVSVFDVYTPDELYAERLDQIEPGEGDVTGHFEMAKWAAKIGLYDRAIAHYLALSQADPEFRPDLVKNQLERLEVLDKNKEIRGAIAEAEKEARRHRYPEAFGFLDAVLAAPGIDAAVKAEVTKRKEKITAERWKHYVDVVEREVHRNVVRKVKEMARSRDIRSTDEDKKLTIDRAMSHLRGELFKEVVEEIAGKHGLDPRKEVEAMWKERAGRFRRKAGYGSGTFIVAGGQNAAGGGGGQGDAASALLERLAEEARRRFGGNQNQGGGNQQPVRELMTRDDWWLASDLQARTYWMLAYFAENGKAFEVVGTSERPCISCGGAGSLKELGPQGGFVRVTCPRCHGVKNDRIVTYK